MSSPTLKSPCIFTIRAGWVLPTPWLESTQVFIIWMRRSVALGVVLMPWGDGNACTGRLVHALIFMGIGAMSTWMLYLRLYQLEEYSDPLPGLVRQAGTKLTTHPMSIFALSIGNF